MMQPVTVARVRPATEQLACSRSTAIGTVGLRVPLLVPSRQVLARFREGPNDAPKNDTDAHRSSRGPPPAAPAPGAATTPTEKAGFMGADHPAVPDAPKRTFATPEEAIAAYSPSSAAGRQAAAPAPPTSPNAPHTPSKETPNAPKAPTNGSGASNAAHQDAASVAAAASTITVPRMDPPIPPGTATAPAPEPAPAKQQPQQDSKAETERDEHHTTAGQGFGPAATHELGPDHKPGHDSKAATKKAKAPRGKLIKGLLHFKEGSTPTEPDADAADADADEGADEGAVAAEHAATAQPSSSLAAPAPARTLGREPKAADVGTAHDEHASEAGDHEQHTTAGQGFGPAATHELGPDNKPGHEGKAATKKAKAPRGKLIKGLQQFKEGSTPTEPDADAADADADEGADEDAAAAAHAPPVPAAAAAPADSKRPQPQHQQRQQHQQHQPTGMGATVAPEKSIDWDALTDAAAEVQTPGEHGKSIDWDALTAAAEEQQQQQRQQPPASMRDPAPAEKSIDFEALMEAAAEVQGPGAPRAAMQPPQVTSKDRPSQQLPPSAATFGATTGARTSQQLQPSERQAGREMSVERDGFDGSGHDTANMGSRRVEGERVHGWSQPGRGSMDEGEGAPAAAQQQQQAQQRPLAASQQQQQQPPSGAAPRQQPPQQPQEQQQQAEPTGPGFNITESSATEWFEAPSNRVQPAAGLEDLEQVQWFANRKWDHTFEDAPLAGADISPDDEDMTYSDADEGGESRIAGQHVPKPEAEGAVGQQRQSQQQQQPAEAQQLKGQQQLQQPRQQEAKAQEQRPAPAAASGAMAQQGQQGSGAQPAAATKPASAPAASPAASAAQQQHQQQQQKGAANGEVLLQVEGAPGLGHLRQQPAAPAAPPAAATKAPANARAGARAGAAPAPAAPASGPAKGGSGTGQDSIRGRTSASPKSVNASALKAALQASGVPGPDSKSGGSSLPAMDLPGPYDMPAVHHVPVNPLFSFGCSVLAAGWWALAATSIAMTGNVLQTLFPAAVAQTGGRLMVCLWGASMLPLAAATLSLKDATDAGMCGTPPADQLTLGVLLGCALPLVVTLQAVSLRHMPLTVVVGGLSLLGVVLSSWLAAQVHPWKLPLPNIKEAFKGVLSLLTPRTWQAAVFGVLSVLMLGGAAKLAMVGPHTANLLMAGPTVPVQPQMAGSLAVFVSRAAAGSLMAAGVVCLVLKEAADRKLLASRFASRMATALGLAAAVAASQLGTSLVIRVAAAHPLLLAAEVVLLATAAFAGATAVWPIKVQALQLVPAAAGEPSTAPKDARLQVAQQLTTPEVLAVMAAPYDPGL